MPAHAPSSNSLCGDNLLAAGVHSQLPRARHIRIGELGHKLSPCSRETYRWLHLLQPPRHRHSRRMVVTAASRSPFVGRPMPQKLKGTVSAKEVLALLASTQKTVGRTLDGVGIAALTAQEWISLFTELERQKVPWKALEVFRWMQQQRGYKADNGVYAKLIAMMGKSGQLLSAVRLFAEMRKLGCQPDTSDYNALIQAYGHNGRGHQVLELLEEMKERPGCEPNVVTFNSIIAATPVGLNVQTVDAVLPAMKAASLSPDIITFNSILNFYGRSGMYKKMEDTYMQLAQSKVKLDVVTYNTMLYAYGTFGHCSRMEETYREMRRRRRKPNSRTFNALIRGYARAGCLDLMDAAFAHMAHSGITPNIVTHTLRILGYGQAGDITSAENAMQQATACTPLPTTATYAALISAYGCVGDTSSAWDVYSYMRASGMTPTAGVFAALLEVWGKTGDLSGVKSVLHEMRSAKVKSTDDIRVAVIGAYASAGHFEGAYAVLDRGGRQPLMGEARSRAVAALIRGCNHAGALEHVSQALSSLNQHGPVHLDYLHAYSAALQTYAERDMIREMEIMYKEMTSVCWPSPCTYEAMAHAYQRAGNTESVSRLLKDMAQGGCLPRLPGIASVAEDQVLVASAGR